MGAKPDVRNRDTMACPLSADDVGAVLDLIASEQARPHRNVPTVTVDRDALRDELDEFEPAWTTTARIIRSTADRTVLGVIVADWNIGAGRAWIHGPWIGDEDESWLDQAISLVSAMLGRFPPEITGAVLCGGVEHRLIKALARELGWVACEVNHVLAVTAQRVASWSDVDSRTMAIRDVADDDAGPVRSLHDTEFPSTYYSVSQLIERAHRGEQVVLVALDDAGEVCGYAAGRVQPDGDGYIDFLAVTTSARRMGAGRSLVMELGRRLVRESRTDRVCLTVRDSNRPARRLYESLGFEVDESIAAYETSVGARSRRTCGEAPTEHP